MTEISKEEKGQLKSDLESTRSSIRKQEGKYILYRMGPEASKGVLVDSLKDAVTFMDYYARMWANGEVSVSTTPVSLLDSTYIGVLDFPAEETINKVEPSSSFYGLGSARLSSFNRSLLYSVSQRLDKEAEFLVSLLPPEGTTASEIQEQTIMKKVARVLFK